MTSETRANTFPLNTMLAAVIFALIVLAVHRVDPKRGFALASLRSIAEFHTDRASLIPIVPVPVPSEIPALAVPSPNSAGWSTNAAASLASPFLYDQAGSLDHFYAALRDLAEGRRARPVRIVHYGDSPTTADLITGDARELLQDKFGDGGSGFILVDKPWAWYGHRGVDVSGSGWKIDTAVGSMREAAYGLGGAIFTGQIGATSTLRLDPPGATSVEVQYLQQPGGGDVEVSANGQAAGSVSTAGPIKSEGAQSVDLPAGTKVVQLRVSGGAVQVF